MVGAQLSLTSADIWAKWYNKSNAHVNARKLCQLRETSMQAHMRFTKFDSKFSPPVKYNLLVKTFGAALQHSSALAESSRQFQSI